MSNTPKVKKTEILEARLKRLEKTVSDQAENIFKLAKLLERQDITINELTKIVVMKGNENDETPNVPDIVGIGSGNGSDGFTPAGQTPITKKGRGKIILGR